MYQIIKNIISHTWDTNSYNNTEQQIIYYICGTLIILFTCVVIDLIYRVFRHFWR